MTLQTKVKLETSKSIVQKDKPLQNKSLKAGISKEVKIYFFTQLGPPPSAFKRSAIGG